MPKIYQLSTAANSCQQLLTAVNSYLQLPTAVKCYQQLSYCLKRGLSRQPSTSQMPNHPISAGVYIKEEDGDDKQGNFSHGCHSFGVDLDLLGSSSDHFWPDDPLDDPENILAILCVSTAGLDQVKCDRVISDLESKEEHEDDSDDDDSEEGQLERDEDQDFRHGLDACNGFGLDQASGLLDPNEQLRLRHFDTVNLNSDSHSGSESVQPLQADSPELELELDQVVRRVKRQRCHFY